MQEDPLEVFVRNVARRAVGNAAGISKRLDRVLGTMVTTLEVMPKRSGAASIRISYDPNNPSQIFLSFGKATRMETDSREEIEELMAAIFSGRFKETVYRRGGKVARYTSIVDLPGGPVRFYGGTLRALALGPRQKEEIHHQPYE